eukprot:scaffold110065_cov41-Tisochrysis_lutea.AAC.3
MPSLFAGEGRRTSNGKKGSMERRWSSRRWVGGSIEGATGRGDGLEVFGVAGGGQGIGRRSQKKRARLGEGEGRRGTERGRDRREMEGDSDRGSWRGE